MGMKAFSIGSNGMVQYANLPPIFRWLDKGLAPTGKVTFLNRKTNWKSTIFNWECKTQIDFLIPRSRKNLQHLCT